MATLIIYEKDDILNCLSDLKYKTSNHLNNLIAYMIYREYVIDAGVYELSDELLNLYCGLRHNYVDKFTLVGTHSINKGLYRADIFTVKDNIVIKLT